MPSERESALPRIKCRGCWHINLLKTGEREATRSSAARAQDLMSSVLPGVFIQIRNILKAIKAMVLSLKSQLKPTRNKHASHLHPGPSFRKKVKKNLVTEMRTTPSQVCNSSAVYLKINQSYQPGRMYGDRTRVHPPSQNQFSNVFSSG